MKRLRALLAAAVALIFLSSRAARAETGVTPEQILLGWCGPLSGTTKDLGTQSLEGVNVYFSHINANGGIYGRKLKLISFDDEYNPEIAIECFKKLQNEGIFAGVGFAGTPTSIKHASMAELNKLPIVGFISGARFLFDPFKRYVIPVKGPYEDEVGGIIDHLWNESGIRKFAIIYQNDALGSSVLDGARNALAKHKATPVAAASVPRDAKDFGPAIAVARAAAPEVVILGMSLGISPAAVKQSKEQGWSPLFATCPRGGDSFIKELGKGAEGTIFSQAVPPTSRTDLKAIALYNNAINRFAPNSKPNLVGLEGFSYAMVLVEGVKRAGKDLTRERLIDAIEDMRNLDLGFGPGLEINYSSTLHKGFSNVYFTVVKNGKAVDLTDWKQFVK